MGKLARMFAFLVGLGLAAGCAGANGATPEAGTSTVSEPSVRPDAVSFFGFDSLLGEAEVREGIWVTLGMRSHEDQPAELIVAGAVFDESDWAIRLWQPIEVNPGGCGPPETVESLVPESAALMVQCHIGGSDAASRVVVVGIAPQDDYPELLLNLNCGAVEVAVEGEKLLVTKLPPRSMPDLAPIAFPLAWDGNKLDLDDLDLLDAWRGGCINTTGSFGDTPAAPG